MFSIATGTRVWSLFFHKVSLVDILVELCQCLVCLLRLRKYDVTLVWLHFAA